MNGLELSRAFYESYGAPLLHEQFPEQEGLVAVGLLGSGSECLGFDDEVSRDHDFEPGFCLLLPGEDVIDRRTAFLLERAYAKLPKEFMGFKRSAVAPVGGARHGVLRTADFFTEKVGAPDGILTMDQWLKLPQQALLEATAGEIFRDDFGEVTTIRTALTAMPEDVRRKRLAGHLLVMAQAGQYNYLRCLKHGEPAAGQLAVNEFVKSCIEVVFLLNKAYAPYYKWSFRALRRLPRLSLTAETLEYLLTTGNDQSLAESKYDMIESTASDIIDELQTQGLTKAICGDLEKHAYSVNDGIEDGDVRNLNIFYAI
ncbi:MAG: DUF4037 domain-containing protein [Clostridia bacterium]|nr:DUF4037 domain-containing protein [Clostridia bacterium]MBR0421196.1 DUF4037 domain-containing protein [Clostridia bacterium]